MDLSEKLKYYKIEQDSVEKAKTVKKTDISTQLNGTILAEDQPVVIEINESLNFDNLYVSNLIGDASALKLSTGSLGKIQKEIAPHTLLFFDLETTGLAGGSGVYPFLIGFAFIEGHKINIKQYFLPDFGREIYAFLDFDNISQNKNILVSYNGKSYDYPLLKSRFILNRITNPFQYYEHIDLLHMARRVWKRSIGNCSLNNIEKVIFGFERHDDIEGFLIPQSYFDFIHNNDIENIKKIIKHNKQDLISLVNLVYYLSSLENTPELFTDKPHEISALLRMSIKTNNLERARFYLTKLKNSSMPVTYDILQEYSLLLKRYEYWAEAQNIWHQLTAINSYSLFAYEELAKYEEHHNKNLKKAQEYCIHAIKLLETGRELDILNQNQEKSYQHFLYRLKRIELKLQL